ncbi:hypothetical protein CRYUN_Cryun15aG0124900 [Craigia yunnanensis]
MKRNADFMDIEPMVNKRMLVLSLGTGTTPMDAPNSDMVDFHVSALFQCSRYNEKYHRIQDDTLTNDASTADIATEENLQKLGEIGNESQS